MSEWAWTGPSGAVDDAGAYDEEAAADDVDNIESAARALELAAGAEVVEDGDDDYLVIMGGALEEAKEAVNDDDAAEAVVSTAAAAPSATATDVAYVVHKLLSRTTAGCETLTTVATVLKFIFVGQLRGMVCKLMEQSPYFDVVRDVQPEVQVRLRPHAHALPPPSGAAARATALDVYFPPPIAADVPAAFERVVRAILAAAPAAAAHGFKSATADGWLGSGAVGTLLRNLGWKDALRAEVAPLLQALPFVEVDIPPRSEVRYRLRRRSSGVGAAAARRSAAALPPAARSAVAAAATAASTTRARMRAAAAASAQSSQGRAVPSAN